MYLIYCRYISLFIVFVIVIIVIMSPLSLCCRCHRVVGCRETPSEQRALTSWRARMDRQVRMQKGSKWVRVRAGSTDGQTSQDVERIRVSKGTYLPESTDGWTSQDANPSEQGQGLESTDGQMSQDVEIIQVSEGYSPSGDWGPGMQYGSVPTG